MEVAPSNEVLECLATSCRVGGGREVNIAVKPRAIFEPDTEISILINAYRLECVQATIGLFPSFTWQSHG